MRRPKNKSKRPKRRRGAQEQHDYSKVITTFSVYIATWNVSTRYPDWVTVHELLGLGSVPNPDEQLPDFFVIG